MDKLIKMVGCVENVHFQAYGNKAENLFDLESELYALPVSVMIPISEFIYFCDLNDIVISNSFSIHENEFVFPNELEKKLLDYWNMLCEMGVKKVVVRSSADAEDLAMFSAAGLYKSILNIESFEGLLNAIIEVWLSFFSEGAIHYRSKNNIQSNGMAILIQEMIDADVSGVAFTCDPINECNDEILIEYVRGHNSKIIDNKYTAQRCYIRRDGKNLVVRNEDKSEVNEALLQQFNLIYDMATSIKDTKQYESDIEWAIKDNIVYCLQVRPINLGNLSYDGAIHHNVDCCLIDRYGTVVSYLYLSLLDYWQDRVYLDLFSDKLGKEVKEKPLLFFYNRVYWNIRYEKEVFGKNHGDLHLDKRLITLLDSSYEEWHGRLRLYCKRINDYQTQLKSVNTKQDCKALLDIVLDNFYNYIGIDHYRMLGMANISYQILCNKLRELEIGIDKADELISKVNVDNMTAFSNRELICISKHMQENSEISLLIEEKDVYKLYYELYFNPSYNEYKNEFNKFLDEHGHRGTASDDLMYYHWRDNPIEVLKIITQLAHISNNSKRPNYCMKEEVWTAVKIEAGWAAKYIALREDQRYYFDMSWVLLRSIFLKIASIMVSDKSIENQNDIFYLTISEILEFLNTNLSMRMQHIIERRKHIYIKNKILTAPYYIKDGKVLRVQRLNSKRYKVTILSRGIVIGKVKIVHGVDDLSSIILGDIIVVSMFHPSWTPVLDIVGGIIMNYGNILSHGAIMAREYGVPVVAFNGNATTQLSEGQMIEIDAINGHIKIYEEG